MLNRRAVLAGMLGTAVTARAGATGVRPAGGAAGMICTAQGLAGLTMQGEDGAALSPAGRWHIGSNTKAMTAALYARLAEQGRCRWGATLPALFPDLAVHPDWAGVRVEDLMGHVAGVTDDLIDPAWLMARHGDGTPPRAQRRAFAEQVLGLPPRGKPGAFRYGNANYMLLGAAIEQAVDADWESVVRGELWMPLGMGEAGFGAPPRDGLWGRREIAGAPIPVDPAGIADNPAALAPAGGVHLTPGDYARFLAVFLGGNAPLMRRDTLDRLLTPPRPGARYAGGWALEGPPGADARVLAHSGSNTLWFAVARLDRAAGRGRAAFTNRGGAAGAAATARMLRAIGG